MAWIESHTSLEKHSKVIRLRVAMRWSKNETIGFLHRFWWTVLETSHSGDVTALSSPEVMAETLDMSPEIAGKVFDSMLELGWIEHRGDRYLVHDWLDYAGRYLAESKYKRSPGKMGEIRKIYNVQGQSKDRPGTVRGLSTIPTNQPTNQPTNPEEGASPAPLPDLPALVIAYLNEKTGKRFRAETEANRKPILARATSGFTLDDFRKVIDNKVADWLDDPKMNEYLCPETLFRPGKFEKYLNQSGAANGIYPKPPFGGHETAQQRKDRRLREVAQRLGGARAGDGGVDRPTLRVGEEGAPGGFGAGDRGAPGHG